jgi:hypothetical protein
MNTAMKKLATSVTMTMSMAMQHEATRHDTNRSDAP